MMKKIRDFQTNVEGGISATRASEIIPSAQRTKRAIDSWLQVASSVNNILGFLYAQFGEQLNQEIRQRTTRWVELMKKQKNRKGEKNGRNNDKPH